AVVAATGGRSGHDRAQRRRWPGRPQRVRHMNVESRDVGTSGSGGGGDGRESVDDVYARLRPDLLRLAHLLTGSIEVAEDVVHDAFVASSRRWATVDKPDAYLRRAVTNGAYSALRRLRRDRDKSD